VTRLLIAMLALVTVGAIASFVIGVMCWPEGEFRDEVPAFRPWSRRTARR
jgi:hypothetical protein